MIARLDDQRTRTLLLLAMLVVLALALDAWQRAAQQAGQSCWLDTAVCAVASPVQRVVLGATRWGEDSWALVAHSRGLARENERLTQEVAQLRSTLTHLEEQQAESAREGALLRAYLTDARSARVARVIGAGSGGWLSYLVLDRGSADDTRPQDVAVTSAGVVGQVYAVANHTAHVLPLTDPASGVAVRVQRSRETGILKGAGNWRCDLRYLGPDADVQPGDLLLTAGTGDIFPKGLRVGTVISVETDPYTPGKIAGVEPAADLRRVEEVMLLRALHGGS